jgi:serine/threonine protein kinase
MHTYAVFVYLLHAIHNARVIHRDIKPANLSCIYNTLCVCVCIHTCIHLFAGDFKIADLGIAVDMGTHTYIQTYIHTYIHTFCR